MNKNKFCIFKYKQKIPNYVLTSMVVLPNLAGFFYYE